MKYLALLSLLIMVGCSGSDDGGMETSEPVRSDVNSQYAMDCQYTNKHYDMIRCENHEVVCYGKTSYRGGVDCEFKGSK